MDIFDLQWMDRDTPRVQYELVKRVMKPYAKTLKAPIRRAEWLAEARENAHNDKRKALGA